MDKLILPYNHIQTAHCENGVATGLLRHHGLEYDKPIDPDLIYKQNFDSGSLKNNVELILLQIKWLANQ